MTASMGTSPPQSSSSSPPAGPPPAGPRRLTRSSSDTKIAGVAAGIAEYFGIDPTIVRLLFVASIFLGGFGLIAYVIGWVVLPVDDGTNAPGAPHTWASTSTTVVAIGLLVAGAIVAAATIDSPFDGGVFLPLILVAVGAFLLLQRPDGRTPAGDPPAGPAGPATPPTPPSSGPPPGDEPTPPPAPSPGPAVGTAVAVRGGGPPALRAGVGEDVGDDVGPDTDPTAPTAPVPPTPPVPPAARRAPGPPITSLVLSSIAIIGAVAFLVDAAGITDVSVTFVLALCLAAVGLGLFAAARWGGGGGLVFVGILVTLAVMTSAVASPAFEDGVGERTYEPTRVADVRREYRHGIGEMTVDLGDVDFPAGRSRIDVHMGIGHLEVLVPRDVRVAVDGTLDIGRLEVFGRAQDGIGNDVTTTTRVGGDRVLVLDVDAGIGNVEIGYEGGGAR